MKFKRLAECVDWYKRTTNGQIIKKSKRFVEEGKSVYWFSILPEGKTDPIIEAMTVTKVVGGYEPFVCEESDNPDLFSCPEAFYALVPETCPEWRKRAREYQSRLESLVVGRAVRFRFHAVIGEVPMRNVVGKIVQTDPLKVAIEKGKFVGLTLEIEPHMVEPA
jgi:hypothetical protein